VVLLLQAALQWRAKHSGRSPEDHISQKAFRDSIHTSQFTLDEENLREALESVRHVWKPHTVPPNVKKLFERIEVDNLTSSTPNFWFQVAGLRAFLVDSGGIMPLRGDIPDMASATESYIALQRVYREKAAVDAAEVHAHICNFLHGAGKRGETFSLKDTVSFCRNAANLQVNHWITLADEAAWKSDCSKNISCQLAGEDTQSCAALYLILRAVDSFKEKYGRAPGEVAVLPTALLLGAAKDDMAKIDISRLRIILHGILSELGLSKLGLFDDLIVEFVRSGGCELQTVASMVAGIGSQEVIKLVTQQFVPCGKTLVYDAVDSAVLSIM